MSRARPSRRKNCGVRPQFYAARARPCAAGNARKAPYGQHHGRSKYMRLFLSRICQNVSCDDCRYRKKPRIADITQGDYWRVSKYHPEMNDNKGASVVLLVGGNPCIVRSSNPHPKRVEFFANLDKYTLDQLIKMYCPFPSPLKRAYTRVRGMLGRIKRKVVG